MAVSLRMHPLRWQRTRPFANAAIHRMLRSKAGGAVTMSDMQGMFELIMPAYNEGIMRVPRERRPTTTQRLFMREASLALYAARFFTTGRNVFELSPGLAEVLTNTTLDGVRIKDILLPHRFFFLSLDGLGCGGLPGSDNLIDGAYVDGAIPGRLQIVVTTRRVDSDPSSSKRWPFNRDPYFYVPCAVEGEDNPTFEELITRAISSDEIKVAEDGIMPDDDDLEALVRPLEFEDGRTIPGVSRISQRNDLLEAIDNREALPAVKKALSFVVNALAWLTAEPGDAMARTEWVEDAPKALVEEARTGRSSGARQRAEQALHERGFSRIKVLGTKIVPYAGGVGQPGTGAALTQCHWRMGHHRNQPHGPGNRQVKRIWIAPMLVRPDLPFDPMSGGHDYVLGADVTASGEKRGG